MPITPTVRDAKTHVEFKLFPVMDEEASRKEGREIWNDIELCEISFSGNKQTIGGFPAHDIADRVDMGSGFLQERTYAQKYNAEYMAFKQGRSAVLNGTPIDQLTGLPEGKKRELKALHVPTIEALAALDGANLKMLGINGREWKTLAETYLADKVKTGDSEYLRTELARRDAEMAEMRAQIAALSGKPAEAPEPVVADEPAAVAEADPWASYEDDDLRNLLTEAHVEIDGRWGRKTLIAKAEELIAARSKAA